MKRQAAWGLAWVVMVLLVVVRGGQVYAAETILMSVSSTGVANGESRDPSISADGRSVAFGSYASNLVSWDVNGVQDIFVHDRVTGTTTRVSVSKVGLEDGYSESPSISGDGRFAAFQSRASNLVVDDTNGWQDIFVHDLVLGTTTRVSISSAGAQGNDFSAEPSISADGRFVAFQSWASNLVERDTNILEDIFVHDRVTGQTTRVSVSSAGVQGNGGSWWPSISADGRFVAFESYDSNLVEDDTNHASDIFVHDRVTGQTERVSISTTGAQGDDFSSEPSISADGRFVAFRSWASNLVESDTNGATDIFVRDRVTGQTTRVSVSSSGVQGNDVSQTPSISADGRFVAFESDSVNLVANDTNGASDIFVHDLVTGWTTRVSVNSLLLQGNSHSEHPSISSDGRFVAFQSWASNLVADDTSGVGDVFVHDRGPRVSEFGAYRQGLWALDYNETQSWNSGIDKLYTFGLATDVPVSGDWDGNGLSQIGVFRAGTWVLDQNGNGAWDPGVDKVLSFGLATDKPVVGDWGWGRATVGVFRAGSWYLDIWSDGAWNGCRGGIGSDGCYTFGIATDVPVTGDWDGDGRTEIGVFRNGAWYLDFNGNGRWDGCGADRCYSFGLATDVPISGDWDQDGIAEIGVFRSGTWILDMNGNGAWDGPIVDRIRGFGLPTDKPVTGIW